MKRAAAPALAVALVLAGCASSSGGDAAPSQPANEDGLAAAVDEMNQALFSGDMTSAYQFLTAECRDRVSVVEFGAETTMGLGMLAGFVGVDVEDLSAAPAVVVSVDGSEGLVTWDLVDGEGNVLNDSEDGPVEWTHDGDGWRLVDCPGVDEAD